MHPGQGAVGRAEVEEMKGNRRQAMTIEMQLFHCEQGGDARLSTNQPPSEALACIYLLGLRGKALHLR